MSRTYAMGRLSILALLIVTVLLLASVVLAQSGAGYDLSWWSVDGGGGMNSAGGSYSLGGAIGQPNAGALSGGEYSLTGGFWTSGKTRMQHIIYLPLVRENQP